MTILNDASGNMYAKMRGFLISYYSSKKSQRSIKNSKITIDSISDLVNYNGMQIVLKDITINNVSGLDLSHSDSSIQTFTVNGYCMFTEIYSL
jgi:hypothetical protein